MPNRRTWGTANGLLSAVGSISLGVAAFGLGFGYDRVQDPPVLLGSFTLFWALLAFIVASLLHLDPKNRFNLPGLGLSSSRTETHRLFAPFLAPPVTITVREF